MKAKGECPVTVTLLLESGAEAGKGFRVEVGDDVLTGLERVLGEQVADLR